MRTFWNQSYGTIPRFDFACRLRNQCVYVSTFYQTLFVRDFASDKFGLTIPAIVAMKYRSRDRMRADFATFVNENGKECTFRCAEHGALAGKRKIFEANGKLILSKSEFLEKFRFVRSFRSLARQYYNLSLLSRYYFFVSMLLLLRLYDMSDISSLNPLSERVYVMRGCERNRATEKERIAWKKRLNYYLDDERLC